MSLVAIKSAIDALSAPTISFTILTVIFPFIFPPSDWFEKIHRKTGLWRTWTKSGCIIGMVLITAFFVIGYFDPYFNFRTTRYLGKEGFEEFWNWFDSTSWYPLGRVIGNSNLEI